MELDSVNGKGIPITIVIYIAYTIQRSARRELNAMLNTSAAAANSGAGVRLIYPTH